ncbi:MAG: Hsp20/alpha crystallin family protein [Lysobacter sp.]|nr:Hsp20/alpha crystallin family protein [Lysobacter sp.]
MPGITRWNPFASLSRMDPGAEMNELLRGMGLQSMRTGLPTPMELRTDVHDVEGAYQVSVEIPGARKEDIEVDIDGRQVSISVETHGEKREEKDKAIHTERYVGSAYRSFTLPEEVDRSKASARYEDGVLKLTLPKQGGAASHRVAVQ